jgi:hypothetical protein
VLVAEDAEAGAADAPADAATDVTTDTGAEPADAATASN